MNKKSTLFTIIFSCFFLLNPYLINKLQAQTASTTITYGGFQACGGCTVCGADYWCFNTASSYCGNTAACGSTTFANPVPAGNIVTNIAISYYSASCSGGSLTATINGNAFPAVNEGNTGCACSSSPCAVSATTGATFPCGVPGYNNAAGGINNFQLCTGFDVCVNRLVLTMTYAPASQATPATQPGAISGNAAVCAGVANTYSIPAVANAAGYTWTVPAGWTINSGQNTTSITATPGSAGNICVTANNLCGTSAPTCYPVTISTVSTAPTGATATPNPICAGSSTTLAVSGGALGVGANWNWYSGSCGGAFVGSGSSISVSPSSTTTYYVLAQGTCNTTACQSVAVTVNPVVNPSWTNPSNICAAAGSINLNSLITGTAGGTWSGTGVAGTTFNPSSGTQSVTYTVGSAPCVQTSTQTITVVPDVNPSWTNPSPICATAGSINLNTLITVTVGGTWSGTGVSGTTFDPSSGTQSVTYTVGTAPCVETSTLTITVNPDVNPSWTNPSTICAAAGSINLNSLITGTVGGTWSGTGVSGTNFDPSSGTQSVTYTVGTVPCQETSTQTITVVPDVNPAWTNPSPICAAAGSINLNSLITGTVGGTWSGTGVSGTSFDPTSGTQSVTYTVGTAPCVETSTLTITVTPDVDPTWTDPSPICAAAGSINLNTLITGTVGGTWSGTGVSGNTFDPTVGSQNVTYTVGTAPCIETLTLMINVSAFDATWTNPGPICDGTTPINLNTYITGSGGGTFTGTGITANSFDPTGLGGTSVNITYTVGGAPCTEVSMLSVVVDPAPIINVPSGGLVCEGETLNLTPTTGGIWISSDPTVATIDNTGLVTGILAGTTNVTFTDSITGCQSSITSGTITVNPTPTITTVTSDTVCEGSTINFLPSTGGSWTSSDPTVATIDNTGLITGISGGTATMVYTDSITGCSSNFASGLVTVNPMPIINVPSGGLVCEGQTLNLIPTTGGIWTSSDPTVATIDNTGLVTGILAGTTNVTFTDSITGCQSSITSGAITVNPTPTVTVVTSDTVCEGSTINLLPSTGGTWTSSDPTVATIDNTGLITGMSGGTATMVFTDSTTGCSSNLTSGLITVNPMPIVSDTSGGFVCEGNTIYLTPTSGGTWTSSDPTVATIDNTGLVTGLSTGTTNMVFADGVTGCQNSSATGLVTVNPIPIVTLVTNDTVCEGSTINLLPSTGGFWTSSDPTVATIDNTGLITGMSGGTATMVFTDGTTGCSSNLTSGLITVNPMPIVSDTSGGFVCEGNMIYLTPSSGGTWTSSDPTVATIDNTGLVTGLSAGTINMVFTDGVTGCQNSTATGLVIVGGVTAILGVTPSEGIMPLAVVFTNGSAPALTYSWDFGDGTPITSVFEQNHTYTNFGDYEAVLIVTDGACFDTATVTIEVQGISSILIPNVFTPNGDGFNDVFAVGGTNLESVEAEIFNRWGQKMFEWKHVKGYWDGRTQSGIEAADGTYFYIITAKGLDGEEYFKKGGFSLIR